MCVCDYMVEMVLPQVVKEASDLVHQVAPLVTSSLDHQLQAVQEQYSSLVPTVRYTAYYCSTHVTKAYFYNLNIALLMGVYSYDLMIKV